MEEDDGYTIATGASGVVVHSLAADIHELASHAR
jgi:hypothetical protein